MMPVSRTSDAFSIPLQFSAHAAALGSWEALTATGAEIIYDVVPTSYIQARFQSSVTYVPRIDLGDYKCSSKVDWIEIEVSLQRATQARHLSEALRTSTSSVYARDHVTRSGTGVRFLLTIQNPSPGSLDYIQHFLRRKWGLDSVRLRGIEVAVDWIPRDYSDLARWQMVAVLFRHHFPHNFPHTTPLADLRQLHGGTTRPQFVIPGMIGQPRRIPDTDFKEEHVQTRVLRDHWDFDHYIDATVYRGYKTGPIMFRIQNKVTDRRYRKHGTYEELSPVGRRARIEVVLRGEELAARDLASVDDVSAFRFERLQSELFNFRFPTEIPLPHTNFALQRQRFVEGGVYGIHIYQRALHAHRMAQRLPGGQKFANRRRGRGSTGQLVSWEQMNTSARLSLKRLSDFWRR